MNTNQYKSQVSIIFLTVFLYLVGFGMIIPLGPYLATEFDASPAQVGYLMSIFSLMQFLFAPFWGRLSDRFGRRPIILICLLGEGLSYILFAYARDLWVLYLARVLAGLFGASIATASAYISDITPKEKRSKGMAIIGVAFGLGFVVGPFLSGILGLWGQSISSDPPFGMGFSALWVAALCFINFLFAWRVLKESLPLEARKKTVDENPNRWQRGVQYIRRPILGSLVITFFLTTFAMAHMEASLFLYVKDKFDWSLKEASWGFAYVGLIMVFTQGYLVRKYLPRFGERFFLVLGVVMMGFGLVAIGWASSVVALAIVVTFLSVGNALMHPSLMGSLSLLADRQKQGEVMGTAQSVSALARILGPASGGFLYGYWGMSSPFWVAGGICVVALLVLLKQFQVLPQAGKQAAKEP